RARRTIGRALPAAGATAVAVLVLLPIIWGVSTSFKDEVEAVSYPPKFVAARFTASNYLAVFTDGNFAQELANSVVYSVGSVLLALVVAAPAGYAASRFRFRGKQTLMLAILATSMVPSVALLVPTYLMLKQIGLLNSTVAIIVISAARLAPQSVWFMKNFIDAVPI